MFSLLQSDFEFAKTDGEKEEAHGGEDKGLFPDGAEAETFQHDPFDDDKIPS
jgi:hypothetical protein